MVGGVCVGCIVGEVGAMGADGVVIGGGVVGEVTGGGMVGEVTVGGAVGGPATTSNVFSSLLPKFPPDATSLSSTSTL